MESSLPSICDATPTDPLETPHSSPMEEADFQTHGLGRAPSYFPYGAASPCDQPKTLGNAFTHLSQHTPNSSRRRKRRMASLARSRATPSHSAQMQKIWASAHEKLQKYEFGSGNTSIGESLLSTTSKRHPSNSIAGEEDQVYFSDRVMNMSGEGGNLDITGPQKPYPSLPLTSLSCSVYPDLSAAEPMSSGFTSPVAPAQEAQGDELMDGMTLSTPFRAKQNSSSDTHSTESSKWLTSDYGIPLPRPMSERELEERLRDTSISQVDAWLTRVLDKSLPLHPALVRTAKPAKRSTKRQVSQTKSSPVAINGKSSTRCDIPVGDAQREDLRTSLPLASSMSGHKDSQRPSTDDIPRSDAIGARHEYELADAPLHVPTNPLLTLANRSKETPIKHNSSAKISWTPSSPMRRLFPSDYTLSRLSETPRGYFSLPPRRKRMKRSTSPASHAHEPTHVEVFEDEEVVELSPNVTPYRRGKGPKKTRTPSYFDTDIFPESSPLGQENKPSADVRKPDSKRYPLGDRSDSEESTKPVASNGGS